MTPEQSRDPDYFPGFGVAIPLGIQHVLAMFVSNLTPPIIVAGAAGFGFGSPDPSALIYMPWWNRSNWNLNWKPKPRTPTLPMA